jgi:hypothetical protein
MNEIWLVAWTPDGGKTWHPADERVSFREQDAQAKAKKFTEQCRGKYTHRAFKFRPEEKSQWSV